LPILPQHVLEVEKLPFHHRDPFDRIIIAQSKVENFDLMSNDGEFAKYGVHLI
jgi:PIN domain nuclease of toxin-antitoxin system